MKLRLRGRVVGGGQGGSVNEGHGGAETSDAQLDAGNPTIKRMSPNRDEARSNFLELLSSRNKTRPKGF